MNKNDLKTGMRVKLRNGDIRVVMLDVCPVSDIRFPVNFLLSLNKDDSTMICSYVIASIGYLT